LNIYNRNAAGIIGYPSTGLGTSLGTYLISSCAPILVTLAGGFVTTQAAANWQPGDQIEQPIDTALDYTFVNARFRPYVPAGMPMNGVILSNLGTIGMGTAFLARSSNTGNNGWSVGFDASGVTGAGSVGFNVGNTGTAIKGLGIAMGQNLQGNADGGGVVGWGGTTYADGPQIGLLYDGRFGLTSNGFTTSGTSGTNSFSMGEMIFKPGVSRTFSTYLNALEIGTNYGSAGDALLRLCQLECSVSGLANSGSNVWELAAAEGSAGVRGTLSSRSLVLRWPYLGHAAGPGPVMQFGPLGANSLTGVW
jgi:hypothetical protein